MRIAIISVLALIFMFSGSVHAWGGLFAQGIYAAPTPVIYGGSGFFAQGVFVAPSPVITGSSPTFISTAFVAPRPVIVQGAPTVVNTAFAAPSPVIVQGQPTQVNVDVRTQPIIIGTSPLSAGTVRFATNFQPQISGGSISNIRAGFVLPTATFGPTRPITINAPLRDLNWEFDP